MWPNHRRLLRAVLVAGLALLTAAAVAQPVPTAAASTSAPSPKRWLSVPLGTHTFGHLRAPDAIVATAGPDQVGFWAPPPGQDGVPFGPQSFDVTRDGSIWLLDEVNQQLLVWQPRRSSRPLRTVRVPDPPTPGDLAVAPDGTIYLTYIDRDLFLPDIGFTMSLEALSPTGQVRWRGPTIIDYFNAQIRIGPDGALYWFNVNGTSTQLTTSTGRLLSIAEQRRRTSPGVPLSGGRRLVTTKVSQHEWRVVLRDPAGRALRGWRVTSRTDLGGLHATPALVGTDPVLLPDVTQETPTEFLYEVLVLRLAPNGGTRVRFAIQPETRVVWGDVPVTGLRVGPDGQLYQLRTNPAWGVRIARFSLRPRPAH